MCRERHGIKRVCCAFWDVYYVRTTHTYEWDTAAGELILAEAGGSTRTLPDDGELLYNEPDLHNPWFVCRSKFCKL